jgi:16S rRNA (guanine527-N7)-methyltransferase
MKAVAHPPVCMDTHRSYEPDALRRDLAARLPPALARLDQPLSEPETARIVAYLVELARWNRAYNLTAITDAAGMIERHVLDSLTLRPYLRGQRILDAGTGAGLPGVLLAMVEPSRHFVLLDSAGKKIRFLRHVARTLRLENVEPVQARLEAWRPATPPDEIIARALAPLSQLVAWLSPWLAGGARLLAMKGPAGRDEAETLPDRYRVRIESTGWAGSTAERLIIEVCSRDRAATTT